MSNITDAQLEVFFKSILTKYNLNLSFYAISSLQRRLERFLLLYHFDDLDTLAQQLIKDDSFFETFVKEITVNTTEMFRDPGCWSSMRRDVLTGLRDLPSIRIWHAGCSSGEEVYSMAIMLKEEGMYDRAKIVATDINRDVLRVATEGSYSLKNMALNEENYTRAGGLHRLSDYYSKQGFAAKMDPGLLQNVRFLKHDLSGGEAFSKFDLILCRNVMIYFNKQLQENVFSIFHQSLFKRGFVVIGKKESMNYFSDFRYFTEHNADEKIYRLF